MKEIRRKVHIPLYGGWIVIIISDEEHVADSVKRHFPEDHLDSNINAVVLYTRLNGPTIFPVLFATEADPGMTPGIIAHEAKYLVNNIFLNVGIELDRYNDDAECYLLSWIVNRIWETKTKFDKLK